MTLSAAMREGARLYLDDEARPLCPRCEGAPAPVPTPAPDTDDAFGHWLAGFIDGEGSFRIVRRATSVTYRCSFHITLRRDDASALEAIRTRTGIGSLYHHPNIRANGAKPTSEWSILTKADVLALIELIDRHPLRSKKARDYTIWREAAVLWTAYAGNRWTPEEHRPWPRIAELKDLLAAGRAYR